MEQERLRETLELKYKNAEEQLAEFDQKKNELQSRINRDENEIKLLRNQLRNLKKAHAEYEDKKSQELEFLTREAEQIRIRDRENHKKVIFL